MNHLLTGNRSEQALAILFNGIADKISASAVCADLFSLKARTDRFPDFGAFLAGSHKYCRFAACCITEVVERLLFVIGTERNHAVLHFAFRFFPQRKEAEHLVLAEDQNRGKAFLSDIVQHFLCQGILFIPLTVKIMCPDVSCEQHAAHSDAGKDLRMCQTTAAAHKAAEAVAHAVDSRKVCRIIFLSEVIQCLDGAPVLILRSDHNAFFSGGSLNNPVALCQLDRIVGAVQAEDQREASFGIGLGGKGDIRRPFFQSFAMHLFAEPFFISCPVSF